MMPGTLQPPIDHNQRRHWLRREVPAAIDLARNRLLRRDEDKAMEVIDRLLDIASSGFPLTMRDKPQPSPADRKREHLRILTAAAAYLSIDLDELRHVLTQLPASKKDEVDPKAQEAVALAKLHAQVAGLKSRPVRRAPAKSLSGRYISKVLSKTRFISTALVDVPPADELPENVTPIESRQRLRSGSFWMFPPKATVLQFRPSRHDPSTLEPGAVYRRADGKLFVRQGPVEKSGSGRRRDDVDPKAKAKSEAYFAERRARREERRLERQLKEDNDDA